MGRRALLGTTHYVVSEAVRDKRKGFPVFVAHLGSEKLLYADDVLARLAGKAVPTREPGELTDALLNVPGVARVLGRARPNVQNALHRKVWHLIPEPKGPTRRQTYWLRADVEAWSPPSR